MRVVAGTAKGHHLKAPKGNETRPTSDKVREAIFGILQDRFVGMQVLDLFAGTGALGIEALSRGAAGAVFVERRTEVCQVVRENLRHTRFVEVSRVMCMPVERAIPLLQTSFGLVLLDPPYAYPSLHDIIALVSGAGILEDCATVVFEHSPRFAVEENYSRLTLQRQKVYGDTAVSIFGMQKEQNS